MNKLEQCKNCGSVCAVIEHHVYGNREVWWRVRCFNCWGQNGTGAVTGYYRNENDAVTAWNNGEYRRDNIYDVKNRCPFQHPPEMSKLRKSLRKFNYITLTLLLRFCEKLCQKLAQMKKRV